MVGGTSGEVGLVVGSTSGEVGLVVGGVGGTPVGVGLRMGVSVILVGTPVMSDWADIGGSALMWWTSLA